MQVKPLFSTATRGIIKVRVFHAVSLQTTLYCENKWHVLGENPEAREVEREYWLVCTVEMWAINCHAVS